MRLALGDIDDVGIIRARQNGYNQVTACLQEHRVSAFFREVLAAMREGPALFFAPVRAAIVAARSPRPQK